MKEHTIKLLEHDIELIFENPKIWDTNAMGRCSIKDLSILINDSMPHDSTSSVLLHEIIHMIAALNSIELKEQEVDGITLGLLSFIRNNSDIIEEYIKEKPE